MDFSIISNLKIIKNMTEITNVEMDKRKTLNDIKLYQPTYKDLILPDKINCLAIEAFLRMCGLEYTIVDKYNAEDMSPSGEVPVLKCSEYLLSDLGTIVEFVKLRGISLTKNLEESEKTEIIAYTSLAKLILGNAENYMAWADQNTFQKVTALRFASIYPWPLNQILARRKQQIVLCKLKAMGWYDKSFEDICAEVDICCNALSDKLDGCFFFGNTPTELDAIVFAHICTILAIPLPKTQLVSIVESYPKIIGHCQHVMDNFFGENLSQYLKQVNES